MVNPAFHHDIDLGRDGKKELLRAGILDVVLLLGDGGIVVGENVIRVIADRAEQRRPLGSKFGRHGVVLVGAAAKNGARPSEKAGLGVVEELFAQIEVEALRKCMGVMRQELVGRIEFVTRAIREINGIERVTGGEITVVRREIDQDAGRNTRRHAVHLIGFRCENVIVIAFRRIAVMIKGLRCSLASAAVTTGGGVVAGFGDMVPGVEDGLAGAEGDVSDVKPSISAQAIRLPNARDMIRRTTWKRTNGILIAIKAIFSTHARLFLHIFMVKSHL